MTQPANPQRGVQHRTWSKLLSSIILLAFAQAVSAAEDVADLLERDWFEVEFFVFERSAVMEHNTTEVLVRHKPRRFPREMIALETSAGFQPPENLDLQTRLCLDYPTLEYTLGESQGLADPSSDALGSVEPLVIDSSDQTTQPEIPAAIIEPPLEPDPRQELMSAVAEFEQSLIADSNRWAESSSHLLRREARLLERRGLGRVLFHGRWLQAVPSREAPQPVLLQAGAHFGSNPLVGTPHSAWELQGTVAVTLGRYLHFQAELFYEAPALGVDPAEVLLRGDGAFALEAPDAPTGGFMLLNQSRRMRSTEVHYIDHPKLGIVVRIDPVVIPETLTVALEALENIEQ